MNGWRLTYEGFAPEQERLRESLCTLGNGYLATRGASESAVADDVHYPGTYVAGAYDRLESEVAGRVIESEDLVNWPNWLCLAVRAARGTWLDPAGEAVVDYRQELDLQHGVLSRQMRLRDPVDHRETTLRTRRLVHMGTSHLAAIELTITAENWSGPLEVRSALDGRVGNTGVPRYHDLRGDHLVPLGTRRVGEDGVELRVRTRQSEIQMAQAARTRGFLADVRLPVERETLEQDGYVEQMLRFDVAEAHPARIEKIVAIHTSRDRAIADCAYQAAKVVAEAGNFADLLHSHEAAWARLWRRCDVDLDCDDRTQLILRLHIFHLLQTVSRHTMDLDAGAPARGLHGEAYRGHVFWDELFILPFLNLRIPELTRALLMYRYRRLGEARRAARKQGYAGAMFPWQSASDGREESQAIHLNPRSGGWNPDHSRVQRHINSAIVYNVWQYYLATGDMEFISRYGAEIILEVARFWASIATYNAELGRYEIEGVMGPDEYHDAYPGASEPGLRNNAYTNVMAAWVLWRALDLLQLLAAHRRRELCESIGLTDEELVRWDVISRRLSVVFHDDGIISQFEGYGELEEFDWDGYRTRYGNIQRLDRILGQEGDTANRYKASKQADVLMLFYLFSSEELSQLFERLGYPFEYETIPRNVDYYLWRTSHGSTLSAIVHAWVLSRTDRGGSWEQLRRALESDIADVQGGTTAEGIHLGAMAGTVDIVQRCYTGIEIRDGVLWLNPELPDPLQRLRLRIRHRQHWLNLDLGPDLVRVESGKGFDHTCKIGLWGEVHDLPMGERREFFLKRDSSSS